MSHVLKQTDSQARTNIRPNKLILSIAQHVRIFKRKMKATSMLQNRMPSPCDQTQLIAHSLPQSDFPMRLMVATHRKKTTAGLPPSKCHPPN
jgi:hypothetical protein